MMADEACATRWVPAVAAESLATGESVALDLDGRSVLLCRAIDGFYAVVNRCSHAAMPLQGGRIRGHHLTCPVHGARFDLRSGASSGLTQVPIETFRTRIDEGQVLVCV